MSEERGSVVALAEAAARAKRRGVVYCILEVWEIISWTGGLDGIVRDEVCTEEEISLYMYFNLVSHESVRRHASPLPRTVSPALTWASSRVG
jgi:hypothetical protein